MKLLVLMFLMILLQGCSIVYIMADCDQLNGSRYYRCHEKIAPVIEWVGEGKTDGAK